MPPCAVVMIAGCAMRQDPAAGFSPVRAVFQQAVCQPFRLLRPARIPGQLTEFLQAAGRNGACEIVDPEESVIGFLRDRSPSAHPAGYV